jgi:hypothetical protein
VVEGANSKRGLANRISSCGCCGRGYGSQARHCSLKGRPSADTYDNLCSLSNSQPDSQPDSHRHAYAYASAYASAHPHGHPYAHADADADPHPHTHPYARLQGTIPKLGMAILR